MNNEENKVGGNSAFSDNGEYKSEAKEYFRPDENDGEKKLYESQNQMLASMSIWQQQSKMSVLVSTINYV